MSKTVEKDDDLVEITSTESGFSYKKIVFLLLFAVIVVAGSLVGGYFYFINAFSFGEHNVEKTKDTRSFSEAPTSIGFITPPEIKQAEVIIESDSEPAKLIITEPDPIPVIVEPVINQPEHESQSNDEPSLTDRRLDSDVGVFTSSNDSASKVDENRRVKLMSNIDYVLIKGTKIPCTLETNIVSEQAGYTSCVINQDVFSSNARVLLIEKGSKVTGEYNTKLGVGDKRLGVIWDRIITPFDVLIKLDSPSASRLGSSGITGKVDNRWGTRIGAALLVSMFDDALRILADRKNSTFSDSKTSDTSSEMAVKVLEQYIDLPPIVYIKQGEMINIYVANDVDLSSVYNIRKSMIHRYEHP